jgi:hypothetical protein
MKVYRDCNNDGAPFDVNPSIGIYKSNLDGTYSLVTSFAINRPTIKDLDPKDQNPCLIVPPNVSEML